MAVFVLKFIFFVLSSLTNLVSRLVFNVSAYLFVLVIQAFKVPSQALNSGVENVTNFVKAIFKYFLEFLMEVITSFISTCFNLLKEGVTGSAIVTSSAIGELVGEMKTALDGLAKDFPEVFEGFLDMVWTMVAGLWNNYKEAIRYIRENV